MSDRRKTLLIVDNDEVMRESLTGSLRRDLRVEVDVDLLADFYL